jgi:beta-exotoxin I transport system permease protein
MRGSIYLKTLHDLRGQILAWSLGLAAIAAANVLLFPTIQAMPRLIDFLESMPPAIQAMVGDVRAMAQLEGFLRAKLFDPLPLLLSIFAVSQGAGLIAGEIEMKSIDLLLARPIPRWRIASGKFLALMTATAAMAAALVLTLIVCARFVTTDVSARYLILSTANGLPLTWFFGAVALFFSCCLPRAKQAGMVAGGLVVASYVFETLRLLSNSLRNWDEVSLFAQQKAGFTLVGELHAGPIAWLLGLVVVLVVAAALAFERRDLAN